MIIFQIPAAGGSGNDNGGTCVQPATCQTLSEQLKWRYATKRFDSTRKIPDATWKALEESLVLTPSSFGLQPWRFVVIIDQATKEKLVPLSWKQTQPADCSHFVVFAARERMTEDDIDRHLRRTAEVRGVPVDSLAVYRKMMIGTLVSPPAHFNIRHWAALQTYIALGNFMTAAAMIGVDTCPMEGIEPSKYDELFGLPREGYTTIVACAAGYRASDDKNAILPKVRFPVEEVIRRV